MSGREMALHESLRLEILQGLLVLRIVHDCFVWSCGVRASLAVGLNTCTDMHLRDPVVSATTRACGAESPPVPFGPSPRPDRGLLSPQRRPLGSSKAPCMAPQS